MKLTFENGKRNALRLALCGAVVPDEWITFNNRSARADRVSDPVTCPPQALLSTDIVSGGTGCDDIVALAQLLDHPDDELGDRRGIAGGRRLPPLRDDLALLGHERARDLRSADVDSDGMHERRV